jgi:1-deoxy-D-xylulose-5-phosphate reductoisomerase
VIRQVAVLGATGAIGSGALDVIRSQPHRYRARVLAAHRDVDALAKLCSIHRPDLAVIADASLEAALARRLVSAGVLCDIAGGPEALVQAAASASCDTAVIEIAGFAGIEVALAAARTGKRLLLGNQETAVMAGPLLHQALTKGVAY